MKKEEMADANFMNFLKKYKPYLYDIENEVRGVVEETGYGDLSFSMIIKSGKVFSVDFLSGIKKIYPDDVN